MDFPFMRPSMKIRAVLSDLDGCLVSSPYLHKDALNLALKNFGFEITDSEHENYYNGLPTKTKLDFLTSSKGLPKELHGIVKKTKALYTDRMVVQDIRPSYSKILLLKELERRGIELICCSNAVQSSVEKMLELSGLHGFFSLILGNDEIKNPKPDPEIYLKAMYLKQLSPAECVIIEDSFHGIAAGKASGARVVEVCYDDVNLSLIPKLLDLCS